jgi:hypothetical protein
MKKAECWRDRLWPRNYKCQIRAPERVDLALQQDDTIKGDSRRFHMKSIARHWEEQFEKLMNDDRTGQYRERLEWFLFKLQLAVQVFETQGDGSRLLIFSDGSVYGEESELDALLALPPRRISKDKRGQSRFAPGTNDHKRCRDENRRVAPVQRRGKVRDIPSANDLRD